MSPHPFVLSFASRIRNLTVPRVPGQELDVGRPLMWG
jgi:hypothetical protein